jgi:cellulose synthase/poly-beta-1,6-N-acetylglucosamine synthase-like glycosyltransferase
MDPEYANWIIVFFRVVLFCAGAMLIYVWALYPLVLMTLFRRHRLSPAIRGDADPDIQSYPFLSVIVAAYNEEDSIEAKIHNILASRYPGPTELLIGSDGSTDRTADIISRFVNNRVRLYADSNRCGKGEVLLRMLPELRGEIVVFSDATSIYSADALTELVRPFADPRIGLVTGAVRPNGCETASLYRRYENWLETLEARAGVIPTAHGCIYAVRRSLLCHHDPSLTNDFLHPILVNLQGAETAVAPKAQCAESYAPGLRPQFQRQIRVVALAALVYFRCVATLIHARLWRSLFVLTSHKLMRWLTVPLLVLLGLATVCLAGDGGFYRVVMTIQLGFWTLVTSGWLAKRWGFNGQFTFPMQFVVLNWAAALGLWQALRGRAPVAWETTALSLLAERPTLQSQN